MVRPVDGMMAMHATEFPWVADQRLFQSLTSIERRPNLLVLCAGVRPATVIESLQNWCRSPFHVCRLPGAMQLPAMNRGTLLIENIASMTLGQQIALGDWLDGKSEGPQIVSVAAAPLWTAVQAGEFLEGLYYRLNTVVLEATPPAVHSNDAKEQRWR